MSLITRDIRRAGFDGSGATRGAGPYPSLRDRSRVVPRSDSACVFTKRERSANAGFTKSCRVIGEHVSHPLVGRSRYRGGKKPLNA